MRIVRAVVTFGPAALLAATIAAATASSVSLHRNIDAQNERITENDARIDRESVALYAARSDDDALAADAEQSARDLRWIEQERSRQRITASAFHVVLDAAEHADIEMLGYRQDGASFVVSAATRDDKNILEFMRALQKRDDMFFDVSESEPPVNDLVNDARVTKWPFRIAGNIRGLELASQRSASGR